MSAAGMGVADYTAEDIEVLTGLDPVRKCPAMYTDTQRPNHLLREVIDNSVDEVLAGYGKQIRVTLHQDDSVSVQDEGRGMPIDCHPGEQVSGVEVILTRLHAGGKFGNRIYRFSGGLHGVGVSVVNALSTRLEIRVRRQGREWNMQFAHGEKTTELLEVARVGQRNTGTLLHFWPNASYFDSPTISRSRLLPLLQAKALLAPGLRMVLRDEVRDEEHEWCYQEGIENFLRQQLPDQQLLPEQAISGSYQDQEATLDWALHWVPETSAPVITDSFANLVPTPQGGSHVNGLKKGLLDAVEEFCKSRNLLPKGLKLTSEDVIKCCAYLLAIKLREPQFAGQSKERLSSPGCVHFVAAVVRDHFSHWLHQHIEMGEKIIALIIEQARRRRAASSAAQRKRSSASTLPGKLADCSCRDVQRSELFLVEGDSAGGTAKQARDREFQAIMPLRGKILNTWEVDVHHLLASREVQDIVTATGVSPGSQDLSRLRYGKICILADADSDGAHIATLLCALFLRHFPALVANGHIYVALPPLYRIDLGKKVFYALDEKEKEQRLQALQEQQHGAKINVQRFKGLGEMNALQLRETTMAPASRRLLNLELSDLDASSQIMDMLLAKRRAEERRQWLARRDTGDRLHNVNQDMSRA